MKIKYTIYAEMKIAKREISKTQIESTLKNPDKLLDAKEDRKIAQKLIEGQLCRNAQ